MGCWLSSNMCQVGRWKRESVHSPRGKESGVIPGKRSARWAAGRLFQGLEPSENSPDLSEEAHGLGR